jgi:CheY-like chemotaxis protein
MLVVADTGTGIAEHDLPRIFDPYFTTRKAGTGTGLGLSVVHGIVQSHGGGIEVESVGGAGTTFRIYLPSMENAAVLPVQAAQPGVDSVPRGDERVLLVDDEEALVASVAQMLTELGYRVQTATSGPEALARLTADGAAFDLLVTDRNMPELDGVQLLEELLRRGKPIATLLCTGFQHDLTKERAAGLGIKMILGKPFSRAQLANAVRAALDSRAAS